MPRGSRGEETDLHCGYAAAKSGVSFSAKRLDDHKKTRPRRSSSKNKGSKGHTELAMRSSHPTQESVIPLNNTYGGQKSEKHHSNCYWHRSAPAGPLGTEGQENHNQIHAGGV